MSKLNIKLITPAKTVLEEEVDEVVAETTDGQITILAHHAPLVSILKPGELIIRTDKKDKPLAIAGGVIEMFNNTLVILADTAEHVEEIIDNVIDFVFKIAIVLAPLMVVIGGFLLLTAGGNISQVGRAKSLLLWTAIGFLVVLLSKGILAIINQILEVRGG